MQGSIFPLSSQQTPIQWNNQFSQVFTKQTIVQTQKPQQSIQPQFVGNPFRSLQKSLKILTSIDSKLKIASVVLTICHGNSYDNCFTKFTQKSIPGTQTVVASMTQKDLIQIFKCLQNQKQVFSHQILQIAHCLRIVDPDCRLINFQCCELYQYRHFIEDNILNYIKLWLDEGNMVMFSDFSLKCLIQNWDQKLFGPNPFILSKQGYFGTSLKKSPSAQLQLLGSLSEDGKCEVKAARDTILYCVDKNKVKHNFYSIQILTQANLLGDKAGQKAVGHALITFPSKGKILTSMTHWIELNNINTSQKNIFEIAKQNYGQTQVNRMREIMKNQNKMQNQIFIQQTAQKIINQSAPCNNMAQKNIYY